MQTIYDPAGNGTLTMVLIPNEYISPFRRSPPEICVSYISCESFWIYFAIHCKNPGRI